MEIKKILLALSFTALLAACGDDNSSSANADSSSSMRDTFKSSASLTNRADIAYSDTLKAGDTTTFDFEIPKKESDKNDSSGFYYITDTTKAVKLYLGELVKGTRVTVGIKTSGMDGDTVRIQNELNEYINSLDPIYDAAKKDTVYDNYLVPGDSVMAQSSFVVFKDGFYLLNLKANFAKTSQAKIVVNIDSAYFRYTGESSKISMDITDTLRGIFVIGVSPDTIKVNMSANEGVSIAYTASGRSIKRFELFENDSLIKSSGDSTIDIDALLLPADSVKWSLKVSPTKIISYLSGPYATFEVISQSRKLSKGEYFAKPDSIVFPGDTLIVKRERNDQAKYYLYQEEYVWLANLKKGDSIDVQHIMEGYCDDDSRCPSTCEIINKKKAIVQDISCLYGGSLKITDKMTEGAYYLHYVRSGDVYPTDESLELTLKTIMQQPGLFKEFSFYDEEDEKIIEKKSVKLGDTLRFENFHFQTTPKKASTNVKWFVPCDDIPYIGTKAYIAQASSCDEEQEIYSTYLVVQDSASGKNPRIIAQSLADPLARDTLTLTVIKK